MFEALNTKKKYYWLALLFISISLASYYANALVGDDKSLFLPGITSSGHYQIEMACTECHSESFSDDLVLQKACVKCHGKELKSIDDSHPRSKFTDPRNADRTAILDARLCITCHREHQPEITGPMGVTLPADFCQLCHFDIEEDRPSHKDMAFNTCADSGCHNFHDNTALYEDYLVKHINEPDILPVARVANRDLKAFIQNKSAKSLIVGKIIITQWESTAHAKSGVNCTGCHSYTPDSNTLHSETLYSRKRDIIKKWIDKPDHVQCEQCHGMEQKSFLDGKHGMRLKQKLSPMNVSMARQAMKKNPKHKTLGCVSCHDDHMFDTQRAAVEACLSCHNDKHSTAYRKSVHFRLWQFQQNNESDNVSGVSCATCHMPKIKRREDGLERTVVEHNQNMNLRPNQKMIRSVCMNCHGLAFSIDALADISLIENNFNTKPCHYRHKCSVSVQKLLLKKGLVLAIRYYLCGL